MTFYDDINSSNYIDLQELYDEIPGERALWRAVIVQQLMDASSNSQKREMKLIKAQAISWLSGTSDDFFEVCTLADLSPDYVREKARFALKRGCQWRQYNPNSYDRPRKTGTLRKQQQKTIVDNVVALSTRKVS